MLTKGGRTTVSATNNYNKKNMQKSMSKIRVAEKRGKLKQGGTIVKGTAGSTGIRHTAVANAPCLPPMVAIRGQPPPPPGAPAASKLKASLKSKLSAKAAGFVLGQSWSSGGDGGGRYATSASRFVGGAA